MTQPPPTEVTLREITELVRTFRDSGWASLDLEIHGVHLVLGRDGAPVTGSTAATVAAGAQPGPLAEVAATPPPPPVAPPTSNAAPAAPVTVSAPATVSATAVEVRSPAVGSFWVSPSPGEAPFVSVGQQVDVDQQLAIVEVMKLMSQVSSPVAGTVVQVCAGNSELVEYDQVLFLIEPDASGG